MYNAESADFISKLLHGVTAAHMLHLLTKGPGSYAKHKALGSLYEDLSEAADSLAEECFGVHGVPSSFPSEKFVCPKDPVKFVSELYEYVTRNRSQMGDESHLQNSIDSILTLLATTKYKLENLA